jgi:uncharacterized protein
VYHIFYSIVHRYRTSNKKGIIGESLAGLFVVETFLLQPALFDFYIAMDPSLWWNSHFLVDNAAGLLDTFPERETRLWFAGSDAKDIFPYTRSLEQALVSNENVYLRWKYSDEPQEQHHTIFRATKEKALIWTFNDSLVGSPMDR